MQDERDNSTEIVEEIADELLGSTDRGGREGEARHTFLTLLLEAFGGAESIEWWVPVGDGDTGVLVALADCVAFVRPPQRASVAEIDYLETLEGGRYREEWERDGSGRITIVLTFKHDQLPKPIVRRVTEETIGNFAEHRAAFKRWANVVDEPGQADRPVRDAIGP